MATFYRCATCRGAATCRVQVWPWEREAYVFTCERHLTATVQANTYPPPRVRPLPGEPARPAKNVML